MYLANDKMTGAVRPSRSTQFRIAVLGAGKIGSTFACQLDRREEHDVTVIARPGSPRLQQLECDEAIVDVKGDRANVRVASALDEETSCDLVIVMLLAHQTDALLPVLRRSAAKCIQFMFNNFHPERLQEVIGPERCAFGMPIVQAQLGSDGTLKATIGAGGQKTIMSQQRWVDAYNTAGLPPPWNPTCGSGFAATSRSVWLLKAYPSPACGAAAVHPGAKRSSWRAVFAQVSL